MKAAVVTLPIALALGVALGTAVPATLAPVPSLSGSGASPMPTADSSPATFPAPFRGRVVDLDGAPVPDAAVAAFDPARPGRIVSRAITDARGEFAWPDARLWLAAFRDGVGFAIADTAARGANGRDLVLAPGAVVEGVVRRSSADGSGVPGARVTVRLEPPLRPFRATATADSFGRFEIAGLPAGIALVSARIGGGSLALPEGSPRVLVVPRGRTFVSLSPAPFPPSEFVAARDARASGRARLAPAPLSTTAGTIAGVAYDATGEGAPGVRLALECETDGVWNETVTDAHGRFRFSAPPLAAPCRIAALGPIFDGSVEVDGIAPGAALVLRLERLGAISGRLAIEALGADEPVDLLLEELEDLEESKTGESIVFPIRTGPFLAAGLRPGRYGASVIARGRVEWHSSAIDVSPANETDLGILSGTAEAADPHSLPPAEDHRSRAD